MCGNEDCGAVLKHPRAAGWQHTPHWDDEQIDNIEEAGWFASGYGVLCKGMLVIDVDIRNGGADGWAALIEAVPDVAGAGMIVETGRRDGGRHLYFSLPEPMALVTHLPQFPGLDFKSSGYVVGPGSRHAAGHDYRIVHGGPDDIDPAPPALLTLLSKPERHRAVVDGRDVDVSHSDLAEMLGYISPDCPYDTWIRIGMAIHHASGGTGFDVWDAWSARGEAYDAKPMAIHWHSFGRAANPVTLGTLIHHAEEGGWLWPVTMGAEDAQAPDVGDDPRDGLPFDVSGCDLRVPPGFVGEVAAWIDGNGRRPRKHLAVAAALVSVGAAAGLRYTDDLDGVTTNLMAFCVAGSRTGKEAIEQGAGDVIRAAGLGDAIAGKIKSEQEIVRNLTRHQMAVHVVDEIGMELQKLRNAQAKGGTPYLEGIIGTLISVYGKSTGIMALTGDVKADIRKEIRAALAQLVRKREENDAPHNVDRLIADAEAAYGRAANGLERPFLSVIGFTTPQTFDALVDFHAATNGFIGRSIIFNERETVPPARKGWRRRAMPDAMAHALMRIRSGGEYDADATRIESYAPLIPVPTDARAADMMERALDWFEDEARAHKSRTGLESLYLGAYELVSKVSLILAAAEGLRTAEHVRWAFALIRQDVVAKMRLVVSNDRAKDSPALALRSRIMNLLDGDDAETEGVVVNRCRPARAGDVREALAKMLADGTVDVEERKPARGGKSTRAYRLRR